MRPAVALIVSCAVLACERPPEPYTWAFPEEMDGRVLANQYCRESLAQSLTSPANEATTRRERPGVFVYTGLESYRIHAFRDRESCEHARALATKHEAKSFTLYSSARQPLTRSYVASFRGTISEVNNELNCTDAASALQRQNQRGVGFWCEAGPYKP